MPSLHLLTWDAGCRFAKMAVEMEEGKLTVPSEGDP